MVRTTFLAVFFFILAPALAPAQEDINQHPATKVVLSYLRYSMGQQWEKSGKLIETDSLETLKRRYIQRIKMAPTIDDEMAMVRRLDQNSLSDVEKMEPFAFYVAYHKGLQERFEVTEELLDQIINTMGVRVMALAEEDFDGIDYAHVLVRTRHENRDKEVSSLDLVSLIKVGDDWKVTLNALDPSVKDKAE